MNRLYQLEVQQWSLVTQCQAGVLQKDSTVPIDWTSTILMQCICLPCRPVDNATADMLQVTKILAAGMTRQ